MVRKVNSGSCGKSERHKNVVRIIYIYVPIFATFAAASDADKQQNYN
jgi:hypothetical protein